MANLFWLNVTEAAGLAADGNEKMINAKDQVGMLASIRNATEKEISSSTTPRSIPDAWARAYLFSRYVLREKSEKELSEVQKKQQERIIGAWRGYLVMLALQEVYDINIQVKRVGEVKGIGQSIWRNLPETEERDKIYAGLKDEDAAYLFYANDQVVGLTHAAIGVVPGFCQNRFDSSYPWSDGMNFVDPVEELTRGERMIVYAWLTHLVQYYIENEQQPKMLNMIKALIADMQLSEEDAKLAVKASGYVRQAYTLKETKLQPFEERLVLNALDCSETRIDDSDFCLIDAAEKIEVGKEKLVIGLMDELMYARNSKQFSLFVPKNEKLEPISANDLFLDKCFSFKNITIENREWDITDSATYIDDSNKRAIADKVHIFPMKSTYAEKLKDKIVGGFDMSIASGYLNAGVRFKVNGKLKTITHDYHSDFQRDLETEQMATTLIWPNMAGCHQYHVGTQWGTYAGAKDAFIFLPLNTKADAKIWDNRNHFILESFPRFLKVFGVDEDSAQIEELGIVMIREPNMAEIKTKVVNYALDFGTSASIAAYNTGNVADSKKVDFATQIMLITPDAENVRLANQILFGIHPIVAPFPTIYFKDPFPTTVLFQGGHPYFELPNRTIEREANMEANIKFDFGQGGDMTYIRRDYIKGLIYMLMVHADGLGAEQMTLKISFPISIKGIQEFKNDITQIVEEYSARKDEMGRYPFNTMLPVSNLGFVTESEAATRYFYTEDDAKECIMLDIGGGSADLFAYSSANNGNAMISSVVAGSRIFLLDLFKKRPSIFVAAMQDIKKRYPESKLEEKWFNKSVYVNSSENAFYSDIECLLQYTVIDEEGKNLNLGNDIADIVLNKTGQLESKENVHILKQMKTIWVFQLAALFYYGGLMYKQCLNGAKSIEKSGISFFLSGRGSQILNWLPDKSTENILIAMVRSAMGVSSEVDIELNQQQNTKKTESAIGMLKAAISSGGKEISESDIVFDYIAGEEFYDAKNNLRDATTLIRHKCDLGKSDPHCQRIKEDYSSINDELPVLSEFIKQLNGQISNSELNDEIYQIDLCNTTSEAAKKNRSVKKRGYYIGKSMLVDAMAEFKRKVDSREQTVDIPLFFHLVNYIRNKATDKWLRNE